MSPRRLLMSLLALCALSSPLLANDMKIVSANATPGGNVSVVVELTHNQSISGYQTVMVYDPAVLTLIEIDTAGLDVDALLSPFSTEFFIVLDEAVEGGHMAAQGSIFDFLPPFDRQLLPPGQDQSIARFHFETSPNEIPGTCTELQLLNAQGETALDNLIVVNGFSILPELAGGTVCFVESSPFVRGDADGNGLMEPLADVVFLLKSAFIVGEPQPACIDSVDCNDNGTFEPIPDALFLLAYSFQQGAPPPSPGPLVCGVDPTDDEHLCMTDTCL